MFNHASVDFEVKAGDRIAQLVCERIAYPDIQVSQTLTPQDWDNSGILQELPSLDVTERGEAGFGSTGTKWPTNLIPGIPSPIDGLCRRPRNIDLQY